MKKNIIILFFFTLVINVSTLGQTDSITAHNNKNLIKLDLIPVLPLFHGHNQKWLGIEYERFLQSNISVSVTVDAGLFQDYHFIKYHDYFDEDVGFSFTRVNVRTTGYHFIPSVKYYFLKFGPERGQGIYIGGDLDFHQYIKKTETFESITAITANDSYSTYRFGAGASIGAQYIAWSRLVVDLRVSALATIFSISDEGYQEIVPQHATWVLYVNDGWCTIQFMIGYSFGGGKNKK